ncbi:hypothetical protein KAFR_0J00930 [Kazachstania africana CBS 2517]|uniref:Major facilitator superfamily (MFS) profile domain-containing protein n=1 Tax=Kazachstania africana (strain ATCC 22294 / BCRC 22015 / CBS 2517 / CECT 1963 / NBRC 1671 / NRRL Y-8276) TaxID=1071382 RepID=H2B0L1_KAZAF|nr:hypothetical protein KAFR_0J00930 [Kazachstania africana CBS 2517]CCF60161.1 hypothetical protein KAFR_0J00930 [Kazachstania africana CBS 2517]
MSEVYSLHSDDDIGSSSNVTDQIKKLHDDPTITKWRDYQKLHGTISRTTTNELGDDDTSSECSHDEQEQQHIVEGEQNYPHTLLTYRQKWFMVFLMTITGFWSSLGSPIYYPALKELEQKFNIDENKVNVTVVVYLLFQGVAPAISGGLADVYGRRPVILGGMLIFVVASIGIAKAPSYGVIVFLRCIQSIGISPTIAISSGVVSDFTVKRERGTFVGATSGLVLIGQGIGPLLGAVITAALHWRAVFWFLTIGCGSCMIIGFFLLPETKRTIVGNLSIKPKNIINRAPITYLPVVQKRFHYDNPDYDSLDLNKPTLDLSTAFRITALPEIFLSLLPGGLQFAMWTLMLSSISSELSVAPYNYSLTIIGVCYLPAGIGGLAGSMLTGRVIDLYYRRSLQKFQEDKESGKISEDTPFNNFKVRLACVLPQCFIAICSFILFGWSVDKGWKIPSVLITSFVCSYCTMSSLSVMTTLLVDLYPTKSSTASSCFNFVRCSLSTIFMGCFAKMKQSMTVGGTFSFLCGLLLCANLLTFIPLTKGIQLRERRAAKMEAKRQAKRDIEKESDL